MLLSYAFGICPPRSSLRPGSGLPCGRPPPRRPPKKSPCRSMPLSPLFRKRAPSSEEFDVCTPGVIAETVPRPVARANRRRLTLPLGPSDACQPTLTRPTRMTLRPHADRPGLPLPARLVSWICQPCFMLVRPWAPTLQRFLPARAAGSSRILLSSLPFVSRNARRSGRSTRCTLRCRGFEDFSRQRTSRLAASGLAASGCVHQCQRYSRLRWVAPLLVVPPLRG